MGNTWDYKFAFYIESILDVPPEFHGAYERLVAAYGQPDFALFSPAVEEYRFLVSNWLPPRLILLFPESLVLLSLETQSDQVRSLEWSHDELLGYGQADYLVNSWFTLYPGPSGDGGIKVRFPARASDEFTCLAHVIHQWIDGDGDSFINLPQHPILIPGLPSKFLSFLEAHSELGQPSEFFFQPAMEHRGKGYRRWSNLLLIAGANGIFVLADESRGRVIDHGLDLTYLPLHRVRAVDWVEHHQDHPASIRIYLKGGIGELALSWPVFSGLKAYAHRWSTVTNSLAKALTRGSTNLEILAQDRGQGTTESPHIEDQEKTHAKFKNH